MAYELVQSVFMMNIAANGVGNFSDTQPNLQKYLKVYLEGGTDPLGGTYAGFFPFANVASANCEGLIGGDWEVVWGPCVCLPPNTTTGQAANSLYVAFSPSQNTYVVAVAATNPASIYDWIDEDGDVAAIYMAQWPPTLPFTPAQHAEFPAGTVAISGATALGISNLLYGAGMTDPVQNVNLQTYLENITTQSYWQEGATLIFSGHSLAGALSPTLAFYLYPTDNGSFADVLVLPTAGATPGNQEFAAAWITRFPTVPTNSKNTTVANWNTDTANQKDLVPHAWNQISNWVTLAFDPFHLGQFNSPWGRVSPTIGATLYAAEQAAVNASSSGDYLNLTQVFLTAPWGTYDWSFDYTTNTWNYPPNWTALPDYVATSPINSINTVGATLMATHIQQYYSIFAIQPWPRMSLVIPPTNTDLTAFPQI